MTILPKPAKTYHVHPDEEAILLQNHGGTIERQTQELGENVEEILVGLGMDVTTKGQLQDDRVF